MVYMEISPLAKRLRDNIGKVIVGKEAQIELVIVALLSGGHVLLEDVPGTGKTEPTIYTYEQRQNALDNAAKYSWAAKTAKN